MSSFDSLWTAPAAPIEDPATETELIDAAKDGDDEAFLRLFAAYIPALNRAVRQFSSALPQDDARQAATLGLMQAVQAFDPERSNRLASILRSYVADALASAASDATGGFAVPTRTLKRFFSILSRAGGDVREALRLAPNFEMTEETFRAVHAAVSATASLEVELGEGGDRVDASISALDVLSPTEIVDAEDRVLCRLAFSAVNKTEAAVCRLAYGFADYDPQPDGEIGFRLGFSRLKALRTRQRALGKMRCVVGARGA